MRVYTIKAISLISKVKNITNKNKKKFSQKKVQESKQKLVILFLHKGLFSYDSQPRLNHTDMHHKATSNMML